MLSTFGLLGTEEKVMGREEKKITVDQSNQKTVAAQPASDSNTKPNVVSGSESEDTEEVVRLLQKL